MEYRHVRFVMFQLVVYRMLFDRKAAGFFSQQQSGQPGKDASDFFIRGVVLLNNDGNKPLIMVDDMQYTYGTVVSN